MLDCVMQSAHYCTAYYFDAQSVACSSTHVQDALTCVLNTCIMFYSNLLSIVSSLRMYKMSQCMYYDVFGTPLPQWIISTCVTNKDPKYHRTHQLNVAVYA
jgi:hypothetical protein